MEIINILRRRFINSENNSHAAIKIHSKEMRGKFKPGGNFGALHTPFLRDLNSRLKIKIIIQIHRIYIHETLILSNIP